MAGTHDHKRPNTDYEQDSELEQYGVWVKAGPEDVDESDAEDDAYTLTDLGDDESFDDPDADLLTFANDLGSDDRADDSGETVPSGDRDSEFDYAASPLPDADEAAAFDVDDASNEDLLDLDDDDFSISLDDPEENSAQDPDFELEELPEVLDELDLEELPESLVEPQLEELPQALDELEPDELSDPGERSDPFDLEMTDEATGIPDLEPELEVLGFDESDDDLETEPAGSAAGYDEDVDAGHTSQTLDLENLDVDSFVESAQDDELWSDSAAGSSIESGEDKDMFDLDAMGMADDADIAEIDLSAPGADEIGLDADSPVALDDPGDDIPDLELEDDASVDIAFGDAFDDLTAVEDEMSAPRAVPFEAEGDGSQPLTLLESIEQELGTIRSELSELKRELSQLRAAPREPADAGAVQSEEEPSLENESGFFEDEGDDDETIALTGAELDNIMNTAQFTEQPGRPTDIEDARNEAERSEDQLASDDASQLVTEITLEDALEDTEILDLDLDLTDDEDSASAGLASLESEWDDSDDVDSLAGYEGSQEEIDALASMDIDAELASIEELEDTSPPLTESGSPATDDFPDMRDMLTEELDLEPFELEPLGDTPAGETSVDEAPVDEASDDEAWEGEPQEDEVSLDDAGDIEDEMSFDLEPLDEASVDEASDTIEDELVVDRSDIDELMADVSELDELISDEADLEELTFDESLTFEPTGDESPLAGSAAERERPAERSMEIPENLKGELRSVLTYMDKLLDSLPEEKIQEFAASEHFRVYKRLFEELGLEQ